MLFASLFLFMTSSTALADNCNLGSWEVVATIPAGTPGYPEGLKSLGDGRLVGSQAAAFGQAGGPPSALLLIDPKTGAVQSIPVDGQITALEHAGVGIVVVDANTVLFTTTQGPETGGPEVIKFSQNDEGEWGQTYFSSYPGTPYTDIINGITVIDNDPLTALFTDAANNKIYVSPPGGGGQGTVWLDASFPTLPIILPGAQMGLNAMVTRDDNADGEADELFVTFTGGPDPDGAAPSPFVDVNGKLYSVDMHGPRVLVERYDFGLDMPDGIDYRDNELWVTTASPYSTRGDLSRVDGLDNGGYGVVNFTVESPELVMASDVTSLGNVLQGPKFKHDIFSIGHNLLNIPTPSGELHNVVKFRVDCGIGD
mgnify:CR=1 FL=1